MISHYTIPGGVPHNTIKKGNKMDTLVKVVGVSVLGFVIVTFLGLLFSLPVMLLWNDCLVPAVTGLKEIGWLQAWGINVLCGILFKGTSTSKG